MGIGFSGFIYSIVLHQIFQVHEKLSAKIPPTDYLGKSVNMFWDGIFHFFFMVVTLVGVVLFWKLMRRTDTDRSGKFLVGRMIFGWELFNIVEGVFDHHLLKLHNVMENAENHAPGNYLFLGISVLRIIIGWLLFSSQSRHQYAQTEA